MREIKLKKGKRPQYDPAENQKSQKIGRDIPLGGPTTVTDTTSYGRQPFPEPNAFKSIKEKQGQKAKEKLKKAKENLDKDFTKPLNPKA